MKGIKFDGNHSYDAYQLFLNSYSIGEAEPNTNLVEIPGVDGAVFSAFCSAFCCSGDPRRRRGCGLYGVLRRRDVQKPHTEDAIHVCR